MAKVVFNNVTKRFDADTIVLQQFMLTIDDGQFMVLVGPSGCGKSTALRLLAGLENVTEGEILIGNQVVNQISPQQRNIAMVFQNYALYPHMTVRENLAFPLRMRRLPLSIITKKVADTAQLLDLLPLLSHKPKQLSGGQRQRVAMGRALVREPSVFLLDEPLSNLDAKLRAQIRSDIAHLQKRLKKTTLYVTHDQVEAMTLGDKVAIMSKGQLQQTDTPETIYRKPRNIFVAQFIGNPGMNIIPSTVMQDNKGNITIHIEQQKLTLPATSHEESQKRLQAIFLGIRPEDFSLNQAGHPIALKVQIQSIEFLGHESLVYFNLAGHEKNGISNTLTARFMGQFSADGQIHKTFFLHPASVYLFDAAEMAIY